MSDTKCKGSTILNTSSYWDQSQSQSLCSQPAGDTGHTPSIGQPILAATFPATQHHQPLTSACRCTTVWTACPTASHEMAGSGTYELDTVMNTSPCHTSTSYTMLKHASWFTGTSSQMLQRVLTHLYSAPLFNWHCLGRNTTVVFVYCKISTTGCTRV